MTQVEKQQDDADGIEVVVEESGAPEADANGAAEADSGSRAEPVAEEASGQRAADDELENYSESVKKRIAKLTGRLREAERREQAAIEYAKSLKVQAEQTTQRATALESDHLKEYGERLKAQELVLNESLRSAIDRGDVNRQIEAQKALATLAVEQQRYDYLSRQQSMRQTAAEQPVQQPQYQQPVVQPAPQPDPKAEAWAQRNEWFGKDEAMTVTAFSIHKKLVEAEGFDPTSDTYYSELDKRIRKEFPHKFQQERAQPRPNTVAPAVRTVQQSGKSTTQVKLTPSQVAIAKKLGVSLEQYARQVAKLNSREG
jgi:hypothetical protein